MVLAEEGKAKSITMAIDAQNAQGHPFLAMHNDEFGGPSFRVTHIAEEGDIKETMAMAIRDREGPVTWVAP